VERLQWKIGDTYDFGFEGRFNIFAFESLPADALEEGMVADFASDATRRSQPLRRIFLQQLKTEGKESFRERELSCRTTFLQREKKWETEMKSGSYQDENGLCLFGEEARVISLFVTDTPEEFIFIAAVEWRLSYHHFVEEDAERPPIHTLVILQTFDNLDSQM